MAKHPVEKHVIPGKVGNHDHRIFTIQKGAASEQEIVLHFGRKITYNVVKLSTRELPRTDRRGKKIRWLNNFGIRDSKGEYVREVNYTAFLCVRRGAALVYHDRRGLHYVKPPRHEGGGPAGTELVYLELHTGDPAIGCD